jgi:uncharacterized protein
MRPKGLRPDAGALPVVVIARRKEHGMGTEQYHEPPGELSQETRTIARILTSLTEEAEAIGWYEQRISVEQDPEALAVMRDAMHEEYKHFSMGFEFLLRRRPEWRAIAKGIVFQDGDLVENAEAAEAGVAPGGDAHDGSLGLGSLRGSLR